MKYIKNEKGVTLIEVLAAVVILTIILGSTMNFFPQMGLINKTNADKSQAINTAKQVLVKWQSADSVQSFILAGGSGDLSALGTKQPDVTLSDGSYYYFQSSEENFDVNIYIKKALDLGNISDPKSTKASLIKVQVLNTKGTVITDTYGYIIFK
jgi:prepilin-type N-terminal cleavage/methylation domain-containing protein